jgi:hypothetical protein
VINHTRQSKTGAAHPPPTPESTETFRSPVVPHSPHHQCHPRLPSLRKRCRTPVEGEADETVCPAPTAVEVGACTSRTECPLNGQPYQSTTCCFPRRGGHRTKGKAFSLHRSATAAARRRAEAARRRTPHRRRTHQIRLVSTHPQPLWSRICHPRRWRSRRAVGEAKEATTTHFKEERVLGPTARHHAPLL